MSPSRFLQRTQGILYGSWLLAGCAGDGDVQASQPVNGMPRAGVTAASPASAGAVQMGAGAGSTALPTLPRAGVAAPGSGPNAGGSGAIGAPASAGRAAAGEVAPGSAAAGQPAISAGTGGVSATAGQTAATAGAVGVAPAGACRPQFGSGLNVAWFKFAGDVPDPDLARFDKLFADTAAAGGRIVRWWFHTNGTQTPGYDASGKAKPITDAQLADVRKLLDAAQARGVSLVISLWSFDMLQGNQNAPLDHNYALLTQDDARQAYIDRVLKPLVAAVKGHPGLFAWEAFNEPEGMTTQNGWTMQNGGRSVDQRVIQVCVNWFADAIHEADPAALVSNGAWQFKVNASASGCQNLYSDAALTAAGGRARGKLDFYQVHYYDNWNGSEVMSPFTHDSAYWQLDKPLMIGEFWAVDTNGVPAAELYTKLFDTGYSGAWAWQYASDDGNGRTTKWPAMQVPMQKLQQAHAQALGCGGP